MKITASMSDIVVTEKILESQRKLMQECRQVPSTYTILDNNIFQSLVREIKYFAGLNMLSDDDIEVMKQELNRLLDEMEQIAARGVTKFICIFPILILRLHIHFWKKEASSCACSVFMLSTIWIRNIRKSAAPRKNGSSR